MDERSELAEEFYELVGFMVVSARGLLDEPHTYGAFRLIDASQRLMDLLRNHNMSTTALDRVSEAIDGGKTLCMESEDTFRDFLDSLAVLLVSDSD